jgi:hypothetical protein
MSGPDEGRLGEVQDKIDKARSSAREHDLLSDDDDDRTAHDKHEPEDELDEEQEEAIDGLTRPGLG